MSQQKSGKTIELIFAVWNCIAYQVVWMWSECFPTVDISVTLMDIEALTD